MTNLTSIPASIGNEVPVSIASWLACLAMVLVIGLMIVKVVKEIRGKPSASEVQGDAERRFMSKKECEKLHDQVKQTTDHLFSKIGGVERGAAAALGIEVRELRQERKHDAEILQNNMKSLAEDVGGLKKANDLQTIQLNRMDTKLDSLMKRA